MSHKNLVGMSDLRSSSYSKSKYIASVGASWPEGRGSHATIFSKSSDFWKFYVSSENFRTSPVGNGNSFEFNQKIFEHGPLLCKCHDTSELQAAGSY